MDKTTIKMLVALSLTAIFCFVLISCDLIKEVFEPILSEEEYQALSGTPVISSFTSTHSKLRIQGEERDSTALSVEAEDDDGSIESYEYEIVSGGGRAVR